MGYLDQALKVIEEKKGPAQGPFKDFFPNTCYEINEKNELSLDSEVHSPATLRDLQTLFEQTVSEVGGCYIPGTLEMIRKDFPDLANEIDMAEDPINELWLKAGRGPVDVGAFRETVNRWKTLHLRAIRFFSLMVNPVNSPKEDG